MRFIVLPLVTLFAFAALAKDGPSLRRCPQLLGEFAMTKKVLARLVGGSHRWDEKDKWDFDGTYAVGDPHSYNMMFQSVLGERGFERLAIRRRRQGLSTHVLDLFGSAVFSPLPQAFDSLTGVRLRVLPAGAVGDEYADVDWQQVAGNLFQRSTWVDLDRSIAERGITKFDLIVIRSAGPFQVTSQLVNGPAKQSLLGLYFSILSRAWERLSDSGMLVVEMSTPIASSRDYQSWLARLRAAGIEVIEHKNLAIKIGRDLLSPPQLPR